MNGIYLQTHIHKHILSVPQGKNVACDKNYNSVPDPVKESASSSQVSI
jgi:hypothetical protein